jgi:hypothetical protein
MGHILAVTGHAVWFIDNAPARLSE